MDRASLNNLIMNCSESEILDYKKTQYSKEYYQDLLVDVMSMANSLTPQDKYIIIGVNDKPSGEREIIGIPPEEMVDAAVYQDLILQYIEPEIKIEYFPIIIESKLIGILKICAENTNRPYMIKKQYSKGKNLHDGLCKVRKGTHNVLASRADINAFYEAQEKFEVQFMENILYSVYEKEFCTRTSIAIRNYTKYPVTIIYGLLKVLDSNNEILSRNRVYGYDKKIVGTGFQLYINSMEEKYGDIFVGFSSSDCIRLGLDEDGYTDKTFSFVLELFDTKNTTYSTSVDNCKVFAKGIYLWKTQDRANRGKFPKK